MSLFRPEALSAQAHRGTEGIVVRQPRLFMLATGAAIALALATIGFGVLGRYSARIPAQGSLRADLGLVSLAAPADGIVKRVAVEEGQQVAAGDVLVELQSGRAGASGAELDAQIADRIAERRTSLLAGATAQARLLEERESGLRRQIAAAGEERSRMHEELTVRRRQADLADEALARARGVRERGYLSETQLQQVESDALQRKSEVKILEREMASAGRDLAELQLTLAEIPQHRALQETQQSRDLASLDQEALETTARAESSIKAPVAGRITARLADAGQNVQDGQTLFALLPDGAVLEAHLFVSSRAVGFIREGAVVQLRYQAYPYQKFGHQQGVVRRVSHSALGPAEQAALNGEARSSEPMYRVIVQLHRQTVPAYGSEHVLLPGMTLEADILLEERRLIEWVFEPLYSLRGAGDV